MIKRYRWYNGLMESDNGDLVTYEDHKFIMDKYEELDKKLSKMIDYYLGFLMNKSWFNKENFEKDCEEIYKLRDIVRPNWREDDAVAR